MRPSKCEHFNINRAHFAIKMLKFLCKDNFPGIWASINNKSTPPLGKCIQFSCANYQVHEHNTKARDRSVHFIPAMYTKENNRVVGIFMDSFFSLHAASVYVCARSVSNRGERSERALIRGPEAALCVKATWAWGTSPRFNKFLSAPLHRDACCERHRCQGSGVTRAWLSQSLP